MCGVMEGVHVWCDGGCGVWKVCVCGVMESVWCDGACACVVWWSVWCDGGCACVV